MEMMWTIIGLILTLMIFSYLFGDNILFRIATYIFVGVASGYVVTIIIYQVILPRLIWPLLKGDWIVTLVPLILSLLLVTKLFPRLSNLGSIPMAYLVGTAAAIIIGGAVFGTLFGQVTASINLFDLKAGAAQGQSLAVQLLSGVFILFGTITSLVYFNFWAIAKPNQTPYRHPAIALLAKIGELFIAITLGALFAGVFTTSITALIERLDFIKHVILSLF
jgi:hypothetical protein